jgi:uncharacterized membrane protein
MDSSILIYFIVVVTCWTMNPFIKKIILKGNKLTTDEFFVINHFVITIILFGYYIYLFKTKRCSVQCVKRLDRYDGMYILLAALTSIIAARLLLNIIRSRDISYMVANLQPLIILSTFVVGYLFFKEKISLYRLLGGVFVIIGIILLNKK